MLRYLRVRNLAVVREVELELQPGLTVLTGETGAGKSILVDALSLLLGARASADQVRTGAEVASVEGIFRVAGNREAVECLSGLGCPAEDQEVVVRREISAGGSRGRAFINGTLQPVASLRRLGSALAEVYGQHEHVRLLDPATHVDLLDHFAGLGTLREELGRHYRRHRTLEAEIAELEQRSSERASRVASLREEVAEIEAARLRSGEDEELRAELKRLRHRAALLEASEGAYQQLYEAEDAVLARLRSVGRDVGRLAEVDERMAAIAALVDGARIPLEEAALQARDVARDLPQDSERLDAVERRLAEIQRLTGRFGPRLEDVIAHRTRAQNELDALDSDGDERARLGSERDEALAVARQCAEALSRGRREAASRLEERVESELRELAMDATAFRVRLVPLTEPAPEGDGKGRAFGATGAERVEFDVSTNVGEEPRPLVRVASGGELSRLLLALRTVASDHEPARIAVFHGLEAGLGTRVAVFDEVDSGIGGRVAFVLARKLRRLSIGRQVLCITHLAPIAAAADHHVSVTKSESGGRTEVCLEARTGEARLEELGRMIAGEAVTEAVRQHAQELLRELARDR